MTVTATLRLPIERRAVEPEDLRAIDRKLRDFQFHPERYLADANGDVAELVAAKQRWIETTGDNSVEPGAGRRRAQEIRRTNELLATHLERERLALASERDDIKRALRDRAVLLSRAYAFCLYPEQMLRDLLLSPLG
jgi:hypothetical protein